MAQSRFTIAKRDIIAAFDNLPRRVLHLYDIADLLEANRDFWRLTKSMSAKTFAEALIKHAHLKRVEIETPNQNFVRYIWREASPYEVALSLKARGFLSHFTAVQFHGLTDQVPKTIFVNEEQPPKRMSLPDLTQKNIDYAFSRPERHSRSEGQFGNYKIRLLQSMGTEELGIIDFEDSATGKVRITDLERTLLDIAVKPDYAGGVFEVLEAYRRAGTQASVNRLAALLRNSSYIYPYHQVIGFYLQRSGAFSESLIDIFREIPQKFRFYIARQIDNPRLDKDWNLYVPESL